MVFVSMNRLPANVHFRFIARISPGRGISNEEQNGIMLKEQKNNEIK